MKALKFWENYFIPQLGEKYGITGFQDFGHLEVGDYNIDNDLLTVKLSPEDAEKFDAELNNNYENFEQPFKELAAKYGFQVEILNSEDTITFQIF